MNFEYFETLTHAGASEFLQEYLATERRAIQELRVEAERSGIRSDMTLESIQPVFAWIADRLRTLPREPDATLPWWIREADSYRDTLFDFDEASKVLIMRGSFYYGEAFVSSSPTLFWGLGRADTALKNMPVVDGFKHKLQLPPILIAENLFMDILSGSKGPEVVGRTVETWRLNIDDRA